MVREVVRGVFSLAGSFFLEGSFVNGVFSSMGSFFTRDLMLASLKTHTRLVGLFLSLVFFAKSELRFG